MHQGFRKELWSKLVEVLIIDEISMLSGEWLDNLERMLRELTHYYGRGAFQQYLRMPMKDIPAFGGIQVVVVGDFYARGVAGPQLTALEAIERLEPSLDIEEEQPHVLHWQTKKPSVAREEFGGHGVGSTTKGKGGKCFKCQQVGHWAAECPN